MGIILWPNAYCCTLWNSVLPSSSGFGYVIPTRGKKGVGSLAMLRKFNNLVRSLIRQIPPILPYLTSTGKIHAYKLHVPEMGLMSSSALSSLEMKGTTTLGKLRLERTACWALTILIPCLWSFSSKISFLAFPLRSEGRCWMRLASGQIILSETFLISLYKCWSWVKICRLSQYSLIHFFILKEVEFIHDLNIAHLASNPFRWSFHLRYSTTFVGCTPEIHTDQGPVGDSPDNHKGQGTWIVESEWWWKA